MKLRAEHLVRRGIMAILSGLAIQLAAGFYWTPGTFIVAAVLGAPLVVVGAILIVRGVRAAAAQPAAEA